MCIAPLRCDESFGLLAKAAALAGLVVNVTSRATAVDVRGFSTRDRFRHQIALEFDLQLEDISTT